MDRIRNTNNTSSSETRLLQTSSPTRKANAAISPNLITSRVNNKLHDSVTNYSPIKGFKLKQYQEDAIRVLNQDKSLIVTAPTGTGKTILAYAEMMNCLREGREYIYTAPLKSINDQKLQEFKDELRDQLLRDPKLFKKIIGTDLSNEAEENKNLAENFAKENLGLLTGDRKLNPNARFKVMTTEIYNMMSQSPGQLKTNRSVVFDEMHYLDDEDRGGVWEESIIFSPPQTKILGLSATIGNADKLVAWINHKAKLQAKDTAIRKSGVAKKTELIKVPESERPVTLQHYYFNSAATKNFTLHRLDSDETLEADSINEDTDEADPTTKDTNEDNLLTEQLIGLSHILRDNKKIPAIYFIFNRARCDNVANSLASANLNLVTDEEKQRIKQKIDETLKKHPYLALENLAPGESGRARLEEGIGVHHATKLPEYKELIAELFQEGLLKIVTATSTLSAGINMPAKTTVITSFEKFNGGAPLPLTVAEFKQMAGRAGRSGLDTEGNVISFIGMNQEDKLQKKYIEANPEAITSNLRPSYQSLLTMLSNKAVNQSLDDLLNDYFSKSLIQFSESEKVEELKFTYKKMFKFLKQQGFLDRQNQLTLKGNIAREFKFNNPLFIAEFLMQLSKTFSEANKNQEQGSLTTIDPACFVAVFSLLTEDAKNIPIQEFNEFMQKQFQDNEDLAKPLEPIINCFTTTYNEFVEEQNKLEIIDQEPRINYSYFFKNLSWTKQGLKNRRLNNHPVKDFQKILRNEEPGKVLKSLERSLKLLEFMNKAQRANEHFPKNLKKALKKSLDAFKRGILDRSKDTL